MRMTSDEFRVYAENVFRLQNEVISAITFAIEDGRVFEANELALIEAAEDAVLEECVDINRIAVRRRDGGGLRPFRDAKAARAVPNCEAAALRGRAALADVTSASGQ